MNRDMFYWTEDSFGAGPIPANLEDVCSAANSRIDALIDGNPDISEDELSDLVDRIWEDFCQTGIVGGVFAEYRRIMSAAISRDASSGVYRIEPEHSECEHGYEWGDDVLGYADNATQSDWEYDYEAIPASAYEGDSVDFGSATGTHFVFVVRSDGEPVSAYWLSDCQP